MVIFVTRVEWDDAQWRAEMGQKGQLLIRNLHTRPHFERVYISSSADRNGPAGLGVWFGEGDSRNVGKVLHHNDPATHNVALIRAAIEAIDQAKRHGEYDLIIFTNSEYLINFISQWVYRWLRNGWTKTDGEPAKNQGQWKELLIAMRGINVKWFHVPKQSHPSYLRANLTEARELARQACSNKRNARGYYF